MEAYETEEQQVEAIKSWWKENGKAVVIGGIVGVSAILGWKYYQSSNIEMQGEASLAYEKVLSNLESSGIEESESTQEFIDANPKSEYAVFAALQLAKSFAEANQLDNALTQLNWVSDNSGDDALVAMAQIRIARIQAEQETFDEALATLEKIKLESWSSRVAELKGDIALRQDDIATARSAYTEALQDGINQSVQMKLDDLAK